MRLVLPRQETSIQNTAIRGIFRRDKITLVTNRSIDTNIDFKSHPIVLIVTKN